MGGRGSMANLKAMPEHSQGGPGTTPTCHIELRGILASKISNLIGGNTYLHVQNILCLKQLQPASQPASVNLPVTHVHTFRLGRQNVITASSTCPLTLLVLSPHSMNTPGRT